jgi:hypothetical protein
MDGASSHPEIFSLLTSKLTKSGHGCKSLQTFVASCIRLSACTEVQVRKIQ